MLLVRICEGVLLRLLDRLSYQRRIEKLSSWGYSRGRKGFLGGAPFASHSRNASTMSIGGVALIWLRRL